MTPPPPNSRPPQRGPEGNYPPASGPSHLTPHATASTSLSGTAVNRPAQAPGAAPKKRTHAGTEKKRRREGGPGGDANAEAAGEKKVQVSSCDTCKEGHRKCNGLEPCVSCEAATIPCTYNTLSASKKKAHDAYVLMKKQEHTQRLKSADIIVARMGELDIAGTDNNFGPILSQVINLPRYEPPPSDFKNDRELIAEIGPVEKLLIDCYFKYFNYYIPIMSRKAFMAQVQDPAQLNTLEVQKLLACVLATGFAFRQEIGSQNIINKMEPNYGTSMVRKFMHFNAHDVFNSTVENCQCYLVLTGFYSSVANYDKVHNLVALAHSSAAGLGLNRKRGLYYQMRYKGVHDHTVDTIELGYRIFWSVVIVCSGYSLSHQSPFITSNDYDIPFPTRQISDQCPDFQGQMQDEFEGIQDLQHFVPMYEIASRIADITCTATRQRPHTKVDEVREQLIEWRTRTLPKELRITPTDKPAIERQSRFTKFYHAISYMFEISLHHTFQLHESHRELGIHGIWSAYCFDAAIGIKNLYLSRPMTRMNSHVILPVAAGAFANIVASKVLGKEQDAQRHCDEIKIMLQDIIRASSSLERDSLVKFVPHGYDGVTKLSEVKVESFNIQVPESPPSNEQSPSMSTNSSPEQQSTDLTADSDEFESEEEAEEDEEEEEDEDEYEHEKEEEDSDREDVDRRRMSGQFLAQQQQLQRQQQQQQQQQQRSHPSMTGRTDSNAVATGQFLANQQRYPPQDARISRGQQLQQQQQQQLHMQQQIQHQQQHMPLDPSYMVQGYDEMMATMNPHGTHSNASDDLSSPGYSSYPEGFSFPGRPTQLPHRSSNPAMPTFSSGDGGATTGDSGFSSSHGYASGAGGQDTYFAQQHRQQHTLRSQPPHQQHHAGGVGSPAELIDGGVNDMSGLAYGQQGFWQQPWNDAQKRKLGEYEHLLANTTQPLSNQEMHELEIELQQSIMALGTNPPNMAMSMQQQPQQQQQQHAGFVAQAQAHSQSFQQQQHHQQQQQQHQIQQQMQHQQQQQQQHQQQQQQQQHQHHRQSGSFSGGLDLTPSISLKDSQLLSGGFEGLSSAALAPSATVSISGTNSALLGGMGFSTADFATDLNATASSTHPSQNNNSGNIISSVASTHMDPLMGYHQPSFARSTGGTVGGLSKSQTIPLTIQQQDQIHGGGGIVTSSVIMPHMMRGDLEYSDQDLLLYESLTGAGHHHPSHVGGLVGLGGSSGSLLGNDPLILSNAAAAAAASAGQGVAGIGGMGGKDNLMDYMNDPDLVLKQQIFSRVASHSLLPQQQQQSQQQHHHQQQQMQEQQQSSQIYLSQTSNTFK